MKFKIPLTILVLLFGFRLALAAPESIQSFVPGSYQQILSKNDGKAFMLVIWSLDCPTCIKDMQAISAIHKTRPELKIILISTDEPGFSNEIAALLDKYQLTDIESWVFADDNHQKLRYEIDLGWYSEMPRTYFFSPSHQREAVSGALNVEDYQARFSKLQM